MYSDKGLQGRGIREQHLHSAELWLNSGTMWSPWILQCTQKSFVWIPFYWTLSTLALLLNLYFKIGLFTSLSKTVPLLHQPQGEDTRTERPLSKPYISFSDILIFLICQLLVVWILTMTAVRRVKNNGLRLIIIRGGVLTFLKNLTKTSGAWCQPEVSQWFLEKPTYGFQNMVCWVLPDSHNFNLSVHLSDDINVTDDSLPGSSSSGMMMRLFSK